MLFTLSAIYFAALHKTQQSDEILNDAKILVARWTAGMDGYCHQQLLYVTYKKSEVILRNPVKSNANMTLKCSIFILY